jgi:hypothetical protein
MPSHHALRRRAHRAALVAATLAPCALAAQSAQRFGVQVAALFTEIDRDGQVIRGAGIEPQFRFNRLVSTESLGALSLGIGAQLTSHTKGNDELRILGAFVEPRWVPPLPSTTIFPYLSGRVALLRVDGSFVFAPSGQSWGSAYGAGGGVVVRLSRTVNLDVGAQLLRQRFGDVGIVRFRPFTTYAAKAGLSIGLR